MSRRNTRKRNPVIKRPNKKIPKELYHHYSKKNKVEITYNSRIIVGVITDIDPVSESITVTRKDEDRFYIPLNEITRVCRCS